MSLAESLDTLPIYWGEVRADFLGIVSVSVFTVRDELAQINPVPMAIEQTPEWGLSLASRNASSPQLLDLLLVCTASSNGPQLSRSDKATHLSRLEQTIRNAGLPSAGLAYYVRNETGFPERRRPSAAKERGKSSCLATISHPITGRLPGHTILTMLTLMASFSTLRTVVSTLSIPSSMNWSTFGGI